MGASHLVTILFKWKVTISNSKGFLLVERNGKITDIIQRVRTRSTKNRGYNSILERSLER
jgi:hypothetical protein